MPADYERRTFERPVQLRAAPEGSDSPGTLTGYAAVFNSESRDLGGWTEVIDPAAFGAPGDEGALDIARHHRVIARINPDSNLLLGTTDAGTLRVYVDEIGLPYEVDLPNTTAGRDAAVLAARGDFAFSSFAFYTLPGGSEWRENEQGQLVRRVMSAQLVDVAPVADPAYWGSSVGLRDFDLDAIRKELRSEDPTEPKAAPNARALARSRDKQIQLILKGGR